MILYISLFDDLLANKIKLGKVKLNWYLDIDANFKLSYHINISSDLNFAECIKIGRRIIENVKLNMRDKSWKLFEKIYNEVFGSSPFLLTKLDFV